jgi:class 3 adenylate cyclase
MFSCASHSFSCHFALYKAFLTAQPLFSGQPIEAKTHDDVTMLFSDIVGFTSICSTATPMMVINMLEDLYNQFDAFCGQLDVYKVRLNSKLFF